MTDNHGSYNVATRMTPNHPRDNKINFQVSIQNLAKRILGIESRICEIDRIKYVKLQQEVDTLKAQVNMLLNDYNYRKDREDDLK